MDVLDLAVVTLGMGIGMGCGCGCFCISLEEKVVRELGLNVVIIQLNVYRRG